MGDSAPASISFRVANVELIAERVVDEAPVLLDAEWYSKNFDFEAWLEAEQPEIPVLQTTSRRMVLEPAMQGRIWARHDDARDSVPDWGEPLGL